VRKILNAELQWQKRLHEKEKATERSICANCRGRKLAQVAKDGHRDTMQ